MSGFLALFDASGPVFGGPGGQVVAIGLGLVVGAGAVAFGVANVVLVLA